MLHPQMGPIPVLASHLRLGVSQALAPAPLLGEHTDSILQELGLDEEAISACYVEGALF
ncbi:MAG: hypothetical protein U0556_05080 [Dehalococcoidia bacterium]